MARGEALIAGAAGLAVPRPKNSMKNTRYLRLLQWRMVMAYGGFEIFAKACLGRSDTGGLHPEDIDHITACCGYEPPAIAPPVCSADAAKWLNRPQKGRPIQILIDFLQLKDGHGTFMEQWLTGTPITSAAGACHLAKILRHATAHGVLSPTKCRELGFVDAIRTTPRTLDAIRLTVIERIYGSRQPR
jgi:hypothetical protein